MKPQRRWMISILAETAREAANPTLMPWQHKKAAAPIRAPRAAAVQPLRAAARG
ncbi:hypothetical protein GVY41_08380 [Frigidibacter albus]|uniref:Uncharacterized protein n=1 Tax=Frigidibacter albus TaxID=1465486 RepID=A0A6L8VF01_9RHOB|nr:hypothetical protein [Frigidibacter albus]MZQ88928.1 hypothetical protein [Frigidibacter albus]NBE31015.1 hypothetical protein [Frigidibacter albus]GGH52383.1 hypothetical protein GCM10011341_16850 [Frigidibacter albus]